jgi:5-methylcytosine-specific restriction endonuclease McrA
MPESRGKSYRKTWKWIQLAQTIKATWPPVCTYEDCKNPGGRTIDLTLPPRHRWAHSVDHIVELEDGGDPFDLSNLTVLCRSCNSRKANARQKARRQARFRQRARAMELNPSRNW